MLGWPREAIINAVPIGDDRETGQLRLDDLVTEHGIPYSRVGNTYMFHDFTARGLEQALGFAGGFGNIVSGVKILLAALAVLLITAIRTSARHSFAAEYDVNS